MKPCSPIIVVGRIFGRSRWTVVRLRKKFGSLKQYRDRNWGGGRYDHMTIGQERQFLSQFTVIKPPMGVFWL